MANFLPLLFEEGRRLFKGEDFNTMVAAINQLAAGGGGGISVHRVVSFPALATSFSGLTVYSLYASGSPVTFNLPAVPGASQILVIVDGGLTAAAGTITVSGNGKNITAYGATNTTAGIDSNGGSVVLAWDGLAWIQWA